MIVTSKFDDDPFAGALMPLDEGGRTKQQIGWWYPARILADDMAAFEKFEKGGGA